MKYLFLLLFIPCIGKAQPKDTITKMIPYFTHKWIGHFKPGNDSTQAIFIYPNARYEVSARGNRLMIVAVKGDNRDTLFLPVNPLK